MPVQDEIHAINEAASAAQAYRAFFKPFKTLIESSPWFQKGGPAKWGGRKYHKREFSVYFHHQIEAVSGHSFMEHDWSKTRSSKPGSRSVGNWA